MINNIPSPRRITIMEVLRDYQYVDARGMGIRTKVIPIMKSFNGTEPEFESTEDYLKTILLYNGPKNEPNEPKHDPKKPVNDPNKHHVDPNHDPKTSIMTLITENPSITYTELAIPINKSPATVKRYLQDLKAGGVVSRIGGRKGAKWIINDRRKDA
jgi:predicted HTH transcriptional regulator